MGILIYNLLKMFKLDEDIQKLFNDFIQWFATPPTAAEKKRMEELVNDSSEADGDFFGPDE